MRLWALPCLSHVTTKEPLKGFVWNLILRCCTKNCWRIQILVTNRTAKKKKALCILYEDLRSFLCTEVTLGNPQPDTAHETTHGNHPWWRHHPGSSFTQDDSDLTGAIRKCQGHYLTERTVSYTMYATN